MMHTTTHAAAFAAAHAHDVDAMWHAAPTDPTVRIAETDWFDDCTTEVTFHDGSALVIGTTDYEYV